MLIYVIAATILASAREPDGVVTTAPIGAGAIPVGAEAPTPTDIQTAPPTQALTAHGLTTDEQIDAWIARRDPDARPFAEAVAPWLQDDREVHGEVSASIGTGDFSAYSASVSLPVGDSARVDLSYSQSRNGYGYGYPNGGFGHESRFGLDGGAAGYAPRHSGWRRQRVYEQDGRTKAED